MALNAIPMVMELLPIILPVLVKKMVANKIMVASKVAVEPLPS